MYLESYRNPVKQHYEGNFLELCDLHKRCATRSSLFTFSSSGDGLDQPGFKIWKSYGSDQKPTSVSSMNFLKSNLTVQHPPHTQQSECLPRASQREWPKLCLAEVTSIQSVCCTSAAQSSLALSPRKLLILTTMLLYCLSLLMPSLGKHFCHFPGFSPPQCKPSCSGYCIASHPKETICLSRKLLSN